MEAEFVGAARRGVVDGLVALFDRVTRTGTPVWVSLVAPSGWGKTRIVHEFYARLAAERQPLAPRYWPERLSPADEPRLDAGTGRSTLVASRRKMVNPSFRHVADSLPSFMWWGIACSLRNESPASALAHDLGVFEAHAPYLEASWLKAVSASRRYSPLARDAFTAARGEAVGNAYSALAQRIFGSSAPGLGLVSWLAKRGINSAQHARRRAAAIAGTEALDPSPDRLVADAAAMAQKLAVTRLPLVVFVEDAHQADAALCQLLSRLVRGDIAVMIVTTSLPGHHDRNEHLRSSSMTEPSRLWELGFDDDVPPLPPFESTASLARFSQAELGEIVRSFYPTTEPAVVAQVASRYDNPLAIALFCSLERVALRSVDGALRLSSQDLASLPFDIRGLYAEIWRALPVPVRRVLSAAACSIPSKINAEAGGVEMWDQAMLEELASSSGLSIMRHLDAAADREASVYGWVRQVSEVLRSFTEVVQADIAAGDDSYFDEEARDELLAALAQRLVAGEWEDENLDRGQRIHRCRLVLGLFAEGFINDSDLLADAACALLELLADSDATAAERSRIASIALAARPSDPFTLHFMKIVSQSLIGPADEIERAIEAFLRDADAVTRDADPVLLERICEVRAMVAIVVGRPDEAARQLELLVASASPGSSKERTWGVNLAVAYSQLERHREAIELCKRLLEQAIGADDVRTAFELRCSIGRSLFQLDDCSRAAAWLRTALDQAEGSHEISAARRSAALRELGNVYIAADEIAAAADVLSQAVDGGDPEFLGRTDSEWLGLLNDLSICRFKLGHRERAVAELEMACLAAAPRLVPDDEAMVRAQENLAAMRRALESGGQSESPDAW